MNYRVSIELSLANSAFFNSSSHSGWSLALDGRAVVDLLSPALAADFLEAMVVVDKLANNWASTSSMGSSVELTEREPRDLVVIWEGARKVNELDFWSKLVGLPRVLEVSSLDTEDVISVLLGANSLVSPREDTFPNPHPRPHSTN